jgi:hypothetical protein
MRLPVIPAPACAGARVLLEVLCIVQVMSRYVVSVIPAPASAGVNSGRDPVSNVR